MGLVGLCRPALWAGSADAETCAGYPRKWSMARIGPLLRPPPCPLSSGEEKIVLKRKAIAPSPPMLLVPPAIFLDEGCAMTPSPIARKSGCACGSDRRGGGKISRAGQCLLPIQSQVPGRAAFFPRPTYPAVLPPRVERGRGPVGNAGAPTAIEKWPEFSMCRPTAHPNSFVGLYGPDANRPGAPFTNHKTKPPEQTQTKKTTSPNSTRGAERFINGATTPRPDWFRNWPENDDAMVPPPPLPPHADLGRPGFFFRQETGTDGQPLENGAFPLTAPWAHHPAPDGWIPGQGPAINLGAAPCVCSQRAGPVGNHIAPTPRGQNAPAGWMFRPKQKRCCPPAPLERAVRPSGPGPRGMTLRPHLRSSLHDFHAVPPAPQDTDCPSGPIRPDLSRSATTPAPGGGRNVLRRPNGAAPFVGWGR